MIYSQIALFLLGCQTQSESALYFVVFNFFSVSGKVLPVTPLLSGVFVHRVFCAYFVRFEGGGGGGVMRRFLRCTREDISLLTWNGVESQCNANGVLVHLQTKYTLMELKNGTSIG